MFCVCCVYVFRVSQSLTRKDMHLFIEFSVIFSFYMLCIFLFFFVAITRLETLGAELGTQIDT